MLRHGAGVDVVAAARGRADDQLDVLALVEIRYRIGASAGHRERKHDQAKDGLADPPQDVVQVSCAHGASWCTAAHAACGLLCARHQRPRCGAPSKQ
jgi:hypothetical protein